MHARVEKLAERSNQVNIKVVYDKSSIHKRIGKTYATYQSIPPPPPLPTTIEPSHRFPLKRKRKKERERERETGGKGRKTPPAARVCSLMKIVYTVNGDLQRGGEGGGGNWFSCTWRQRVVNWQHIRRTFFL